MDEDDLLARIQRHGRLHGRNESRRVTCAVLTVLSELLPAPAYRRVIALLPDEVRLRLPRPGAGRILPVTDRRGFLARIAERAYADGPDAAFYARVVLEQLNAVGHGGIPAGVAHLLPADLRPLFEARRAAAPAVTVATRAGGPVRRHEPALATQ